MNAIFGKGPVCTESKYNVNSQSCGHFTKQQLVFILSAEMTIDVKMVQYYCSGVRVFYAY